MNLLAPIVFIAILAIVAIVAIVAGLVWLGRGITSALGARYLAAVLPIVGAVGVLVFLFLALGVSSTTMSRHSERQFRQATVVSPDATREDNASPPHGVLEALPERVETPVSIEVLSRPTDNTDPAWINGPTQSIDGKFRTHIVAGPYDRLLDCETELDQKLLAEACKYVEREFGAGLVEPSMEYLRANIVVDEHVEPTRHEFGGVSQEMYQVYRLLEFDEADRNYFAALSRDTKVERRLAYAGFGLASILVLLSTLFGYLRIDQATAGQFRRRLQLATTAVILSLLGGAVVFVRLVPLV